MENNDKAKVCNYEYDVVWGFIDNITVVKLDNKMFHIGLDGKPLYKERYNKVG